jgi:hypothetical protein
VRSAGGSVCAGLNSVGVSVTLESVTGSSGVGRELTGWWPLIMTTDGRGYCQSWPAVSGMMLRRPSSHHTERAGENNDEWT